MTTYPLTAYEIANLLTDWMDAHDWPPSRPDWDEEKADEHFGANIWSDLLLGSDWYDGEATDEADPGYRSDVVVTTNGDVIRWDESTRQWTVDSHISEGAAS